MLKKALKVQRNLYGFSGCDQHFGLAKDVRPASLRSIHMAASHLDFKHNCGYTLSASTRITIPPLINKQGVPVSVGRHFLLEEALSPFSQRVVVNILLHLSAQATHLFLLSVSLFVKWWLERKQGEEQAGSLIRQLGLHGALERPG